MVSFHVVLSDNICSRFLLIGKYMLSVPIREWDQKDVRAISASTGTGISRCRSINNDGSTVREAMIQQWFNAPNSILQLQYSRVGNETNHMVLLTTLQQSNCYPIPQKYLILLRTGNSITTNYQNSEYKRSFSGYRRCCTFVHRYCP